MLSEISPTATSKYCVIVVTGSSLNGHIHDKTGGRGKVTGRCGESLDTDFLLGMMRRFWKETAVVVQCVSVLNVAKLYISEGWSSTF